jgi:hypothetical protein
LRGRHHADHAWRFSGAGDIPVLDDLHKAHTLTITLSPQHHMVGTVVHTHKLGNGDLELQINV